MWKRIAILLCIALVAPLLFAAQTGNVLIQWNANTEPDLAGYNVYWNNVKVGTVAAPAHSWAGSVTINEGANYATVDAFDTSGNTSAKSEPAILVLDTTPPAVPTGCTVVRQ